MLRVSLPFASAIRTNTVPVKFQSAATCIGQRRFMAQIGRIQPKTIRIERSKLTPGKIAMGLGAAAGVIGLGMLGAAAEQSPSGSVSTGSSLNPARFWQPHVRTRVHQTFISFGSGIALTAVTAVSAWRSPRIMAIIAQNPNKFLIGSFVASIGALVATHLTPNQSAAKYASFAAFSGITGLTLAPLGVLGGPIVLQAAAYTGGIVSSLSLIAANSPSDQFLWMAGPLAIGLGAVCVASFGSVLFPTARLAPAMYKFSLYGGLALFSGFVLFDTSQIIYRAQLMPNNQFDPVSESLRIYLDAINIFIRIATILGGQKSRQR